MTSNSIVLETSAGHVLLIIDGSKVAILRPNEAEELGEKLQRISMRAYFEQDILNGRVTVCSECGIVFDSIVSLALHQKHVHP